MAEGQSRIAQLHIMGSMPQSVPKDESKNLSNFQSHLESERSGLRAMPPGHINLYKLAGTLPDLSARIRRWVLESSRQDMEFPVKASPEEIQIEDSRPFVTEQVEEFITIVRTSGCMFLCNKLGVWARRDFSRRHHRARKLRYPRLIM